jgi:hypothetical protein
MVATALQTTASSRVSNLLSLCNRGITWSIKRKHRHKLLATEMDYLRHSARISKMDRVRNETMKPKWESRKTLYKK